MKEKALTGGGLACHELTGEKSADVILVIDPSFSGEIKAGREEVSQSNEGLNVKKFQMWHGVSLLRI